MNFWYSGAAVFAVALFGSGIPVAMNKLQSQEVPFGDMDVAFLDLMELLDLSKLTAVSQTWSNYVNII